MIPSGWPAIGKVVRFVIPLQPANVGVLFERIRRMIRASLGGKVIAASMQGTLGGLMFAWLGLPAPVFWGSMMAVLSIFSSDRSVRHLASRSNPVCLAGRLAARAHSRRLWSADYSSGG